MCYFNGFLKAFDKESSHYHTESMKIIQIFLRNKKKRTFSYTYHDHGTPRYDNPGSVRDLAFPVPGDAGVVADVFVSYVRYAQLRTIVENAYREK